MLRTMAQVSRLNRFHNLLLNERTRRLTVLNARSQNMARWCAFSRLDCVAESGSGSGIIFVTFVTCSSCFFLLQVSDIGSDKRVQDAWNCTAYMQCILFALYDIIPAKRFQKYAHRQYMGIHSWIIKPQAQMVLGHSWTSDASVTSIVLHLVQWCAPEIWVSLARSMRKKYHVFLTFRKAMTVPIPGLNQFMLTPIQLPEWCQSQDGNKPCGRKCPRFLPYIVLLGVLLVVALATLDPSEAESAYVVRQNKDCCAVMTWHGSAWSMARPFWFFYRCHCFFHCSNYAAEHGIASSLAQSTRLPMCSEREHMFITISEWEPNI